MTKTILINKENKIKNNYLNRVELVETRDIEDNSIQIEKETYDNYLALKKYLETLNINIGISSAYRSIEKQEEVEKFYLDKYGKEYTDQFVAPPGYSEHHTGLAIDFYIEQEDGFPTDDANIYRDIELYKKVHEYLHEYGFILRYPEGKESITGYTFEPWHIRYVGKFVANIMKENDLTLEEYVNNFSGLIAVNKKKGMTSFDVVNEIKHLFGIKKVGHTGTLDPLAEGVLIIAIGKATKIVELVTKANKEYIADVVLGIRTDTRDITGTIIDENKDIKMDRLEEVIKEFQKTYMQEVPIYSAVKVKGKKLYEYARKNEQVELPKKEVTIEKLELLEKNNNEFKIKATVSKGTYIRSLIDDIGEALGTHATMKSLTRTKQANISIEESYTLDEIKDNKYKLLTIEYTLDYPIEVVKEDVEKRIRTGQRLKKEDFNCSDKIIFKSKTGKLLGIYEVDNDELKVWKNF